MDPESAAVSPAARRAVDRFDPTPTPLRRVVVSGIARASRSFMRGGHRVHFTNPERLAEARRASGRGLLTFSNHVSLFDDPWLTACLVEPFWADIRWIATDALNFFGGPVRAAIFNAGKCVPVIRGGGLRQPGMDFLVERLRAGDWVHVFPEGGRTRSPTKALHRPFKGGLAYMVEASRPLLLPFHHRGMGEVLPIGAWVPRLGKSVQVAFGETTDSDRGLADRPRDEITAWAEGQLVELEARTPA